MPGSLRGAHRRLAMASIPPARVRSGHWNIRPRRRFGPVSRWNAVAMAKALVTRQELALIALREIRSFPGGEHVTSVEVDGPIDRTAKTNWTLHVFTNEGADMPRIQFAITTTRK